MGGREEEREGGREGSKGGGGRERGREESKREDIRCILWCLFSAFLVNYSNTQGKMAKREQRDPCNNNYIN